MFKYECPLCKAANLVFESNYYSPADFIVGKKSSKIWIIGINPKKEKDDLILHNKPKIELENYFKDMSDKKIHSYYEDFKKVSNRLYELIEKDEIASTDIVKCFSEKKPEAISFKNCIGYFKQQIETQLQLNSMPKILICNGAPICDEISKILPLKTRGEHKSEHNEIHTAQTIRFHDYEITVIFSGFIGRIDDYAKRRLGKEIETYMDKYGL